MLTTCIDVNAVRSLSSRFSEKTRLQLHNSRSLETAYTLQ